MRIHSYYILILRPPPQIINTYTEAVQTVDVSKAVGKPHTLWVNFAKFYEDNGQLPEVHTHTSLSHWMMIIDSKFPTILVINYLQTFDVSLKWYSVLHDLCTCGSLVMVVLLSSG